MLDLWLIFFASLLLLSNSICSRNSFNAQDSIIYIDWSLLWYSGILLKFLLGCTNPKRGNLSSIPMSGKIAYIAHSAVESAQIKGSNLRTPLGRGCSHFPCLVICSQKQELCQQLVIVGKMERWIFVAYISLLLLSPRKFRSGHGLGF